MPKPHREFMKIDVDSLEWESPPDFPDGVQQVVLAEDIDDEKKIGGRTILLRFLPNTYADPFEHGYHEEILLLEGSMTLTKTGEVLKPYTYAVRPPHVPHGPIYSKDGCLLIEFHYYEKFK